MRTAPTIVPGLTAAALVLAGCAGPTASPVASPGMVRGADAATPTVEQWEFMGRPGKMIRTDSYRIFTTEADPTLVAAMPVFLEEALNTYTTEFGPLPRPPMKLDTFLMGDRQQWESLTRQLMGEQAGPYLKIDRGGFASGGRAVLRGIGRRDTLAIAAHEGWHQYTQRTFKDLLPVWLEEGAAVWMEGFVMEPGGARPEFRPWANAERYDQLVRIVNDNRIWPLKQLLATSPQTLIGESTEATLTYYAQLWGLMLFLREGAGGRFAPDLRRVMADAASGRLDEALKGASAASRLAPRGIQVFNAYFADPEAVGREYTTFLRTITEPRFRPQIVRGESPVSGASR
jgi:hypothetical protein